MKGRKRITRWILLLCLLATMVPFLINGTFLGWTLLGRSEQEDLRESNTISFMNAQIIDAFVQDPLKALKLALELTEREQPAIRSGSTPIFDALLHQYAIFTAIEYLDSSGTVLACSPHDDARIGFTRSGEDWFRAMGADTQVLWSKTLHTDYSPVPSVTVVVRGTSHLAVAYLNLTALTQVVNHLNESMSNGMTVAVTDAYGIYIAHPDLDRVRRGDFDPHFDDIRARQNQPGTAAQRALRYNGESYLVSAHVIPGPGWHVITYAPHRLTIRTVLSMLPASLGILLVTLLGAVLPALLLLRRLRTSFDELERQTTRIASGHFDQRVDAQSFDEFNRLADSFNAMTQALRARDRQLTDLAYTDSLTGLPNRAALADRLRNELQSTVPGERIALLFIDIDNFKSVNDSLGHVAGDHVLMEVGRRLTDMLPERCMAARMGGDEFLLLLRTTLSDDELGQSVAAMVDRLGQPYHLSGHSIWLGASIGVALYPEVGDRFESLLQSADTAMYQAKAEGRKTFRFCTPGMLQAQIQRYDMARSLHDTVIHGGMRLVFQPIVRIEDSSVSGFEALLRWELNGVSIPPDQFIPIAEETGLIIQLGEWVLQESCLAHASWRKEGFEGFVSVNVSPVQLRAVDFVSTVRDVLQRTGMRPECLSLEITESVLIDNPDDTIHLLEQLGQMGLHLSLDDFGTGYSSLNYLTRLPLDVVKIDRAFVTRSMEGGTGTVMLRNILRLAHELSLRTIAEGVETSLQVEYLRSHHCDEAQGWHYSKALSAEDALHLIHSNQGHAHLATHVTDA